MPMPNTISAFATRLGIGVPQDLSAARQWYALAADKGHPSAQLALADMLAESVREPRRNSAKPSNGIVSPAMPARHLHCSRWRVCASKAAVFRPTPPWRWRCTAVPQARALQRPRPPPRALRQRRPRQPHPRLHPAETKISSNRYRGACPAGDHRSVLPSGAASVLRS